MIRYGITHNFYTLKYFQASKLSSLRATNIVLGSNEASLERYSQTVIKNLETLQKSLELCLELGIRAYSPGQLCPLASHETLGYTIKSLRNIKKIKELGTSIHKFCNTNDIRITFEANKHCVIGANRKEIVQNSLRELSILEELQHILKVDDIIILELGNKYGSKEETFLRTEQEFYKLSPWLQQHITFTNSYIYSINEVSEFCTKLKIPFVLNLNPIELKQTQQSILDNIDSFSEKFEPIIRLSSRPFSKDRGIDKYIHEDLLLLNYPTNNFTFQVEASYKELAIKKLKELQQLEYEKTVAELVVNN